MTRIIFLLWDIASHILSAIKFPGRKSLWWTLILLGLFIIIIVGSFIGFKYRITLQYWYLNIRRKYHHYSRLDGDSKEYKYSAFVAYHNSDYKWVWYSSIWACLYVDKHTRYFLYCHQYIHTSNSPCCQVKCVSLVSTV
jgi:hypothetical protein